MADPLSMTAAVDLIRAAAQDAPPTEQPEIETPEQPDEAPADAVEAGELEIDASTDDAEETATEDETPENVDDADDAEPDDEDVYELPEVMQRGEDGEWYIETNVFGEKSLERLDSVIARAQKDKAADQRLVDAKEQARQAYEAQRQATAQLQAYGENVAALQNELTALQDASRLTPEQEAALQAENPNALIELKKMQEARSARLSELSQQQAAAKQAIVEQNTRLAYELLPEWQDPEVLARERDGIITVAKAAGFSDAEVYNEIVDARYLPVFRKAWLYDQQMTKQQTAKTKARQAPKLVKKKPPVAPPSEGQKKRRAAYDRLNKTGKVNDAVEALLARRS